MRGMKWLLSLVAVLGGLCPALGQDPFESFVWSEGASAPVRIDTRAELVASGVECVYEREGMTCDGAALAAEWDTTQVADGVHVLAVGEESVTVSTVNTSGVVEGGRLSASVIWDAALPHVVRHWVVVPSGVTLTIAAGAEVRFVSGAGIWVEDGGTLAIADAGERVLFTSLTEGATASYQLIFAPSAVFADYGQLQVENCAGVARWGSVSAANSVTSEMYASVNVPITVSGTRDVPITVAWSTEDGTAIAGEDYTMSSGTLTFVQNGATTQYVSIPILQDEVTEETESFSVRLTAAWGVNISRAVATVTLNNFDVGADPFSGFACAEGSSTAVRVDARATLGGQLAHGTVTLSTAGGEEILLDGVALESPTWETTTVADGLHTLTQGGVEAPVAVLNDTTVQIEYGRLTEDVTWDKSVTHLVRNWVVVPSGVTLTITEGTVVKFTPGTGIWVEDGGTLAVSGSEEELVMFTHSADDTLGAVTDVTDAAPTMNAYSIVKAPSGTFTDNGWLAAMWSDVGTFGRVTLHAATTTANAPDVRIPVTLSGTRNQAFTLRWLAEDGTAKLGEDYALASGAVTWTGTSQGTKYIVIPLIDNPENTASRAFTVRVQVVCGMNASMVPVTVVLYRNGMDAVLGACQSAEGTSAVVRVDGRLNDYGRIAHEAESMTEALGAVTCDGSAVGALWETAALEDGLHTLNASEGDCEVLTLNGETLDVVGGRLDADTTWSAETLYVVRHWVVVPSGKTLTVTAGTVVKFAEGAGIRVEDGGTLNIVGAAEQDVIFTHLADDTVGGDTDARPQPEDLAYNTWSIVKAPSGTVKDNGYWQVRTHTISTNFASLMLHDAMVDERQGEVWVPITVGGTREAPFSVEWEVEANEDLVAPLSGTVTWNRVADGTKYIKLPVVVDAVTEGHEQFKLRLTTVRGANITDREATITLYDSEPVVKADVLAASYQSEGNQPTSPVATVAPITDDFRDTLIVDGATSFRYSPYWQADTADWQAASVEIAATRVDDGERMTLFLGGAGEEGEFTWQVRNQDDGDYLVTHSVLNAEGEVVSVLSRVMHYITGVALHSGLITADETWSKDKVHLIYGDVTVGAGVTLTIEAGAVVKFCDGTGIYAEDYTATAIANGVIFTHFADDTVGGDTNLDGSSTKPLYGEYTLGAHVVVDEATELRCRTPHVLTSLTGGQSMTLESGNVYLVKQNINFPSGTTLIIEPGVVVKFYANTSMTIASGATLQAQGTRAAPIIFTSYRDDTYGGDTNEDGNTLPQPGDWQSVVFTGGTGIFDYTHIRYACKEQQGAIYMTGGNVEFHNGVIYESRYDAIGVENGEFSMSNSVVSGAATAFRHWAKGAIVNSVFYGCGKLTQGGGQQFHNCIFMDIDTRWEAFGWNSSTTFNHCVFWNHDGDPVRGESALDKVGQDGNVWGDPLFVDPENGDFHIQEGSVAVDMADGSIAPATDHYGQPRMDVESAENTGTQSENGAYPDSGIHELMPRTATADVDLAITAISVPEVGEVGKEATFTWTVQNLGAEPIDGSWRDTVFLINEYGQEVELGTVTVKGYIAPDSIKRTERTFLIPPMADGNWSLKVITNAYRDIFEGTLVANNVAVSPIAMQVTVKTLTVASSQVVVGPGGWAAYRVDPQEDGTSITIQGSRTSSGIRSVFSSTPFTGIPETTKKTLYSVGATGGWFFFTNKGNESELVLVTLRRQLLVNGVSPQFIEPSVAELECTILGSGFTEDTRCTLIGQATYPMVSKTLLSPYEMRVTFANIKEKNGTGLQLVVENGDTTVTQDEAIVANSSVSLDGLKAELCIPSAVRPGRTYKGALIYENTSDHVLPVPLFKIYSDTTPLTHLGEEVWAQELFAVGLGQSENPGVLLPNEKGEIYFYFTAKTPTSVSFATVTTEDDAPRASIFETYSELSRALSSAVTNLAPTYNEPVYDALPYLSWAMEHETGGKDGVISGQLFLNDASACANTSFALLHEETEARVEITTDADGYFRVDGLTSGVYAFVADWCHMVTPAVLTVDGCMSNVQLICTPKGKLYGVVKDDAGMPVAGATLWGTFGSTTINTTTDTNGTWTLLGDFTTAGEICLVDKSGLHARTTVKVEAVTLTESKKVDVMPVATGVVSGTLLTTFGTPFAKGDIIELNSKEKVYTVQIEQDGSFIAKELVGGTYTINVPEEYTLLGENSILVTPGQNTRLSLTVKLVSPVKAFPKLQVAGEMYTYEVATEYQDLISSCLWDFDSDGTTDATGLSVSYTYPTVGEYALTVTYTLNNEVITWTSPQISVGEHAVLNDNVVVITEEFGWKLLSFDDGIITLEKVQASTSVSSSFVRDTINEGDILAVWSLETPILRVISTTTIEAQFICTVTVESFSALLDTGVSIKSTREKSKLAPKLLGTLPIDADFPCSIPFNKEVTGGFEAGWLEVSGEGSGVIRERLALKGHLQLWLIYPYRTLMLSGHLSRTFTGDASLNGEITFKKSNLESNEFVKTWWMGPVPVFARFKLFANLGITTAGSLNWFLSETESFDFYINFDGVHRNDLRKINKEEFNASGTISVGIEGGAEGSLGIGFTAKIAEDLGIVGDSEVDGDVAEASLAKVVFSPSFYLNGTYSVTGNELEENSISLNFGCKFPIRITIGHFEAFGMSFTAHQWHWDNKLELINDKYNSVMPRFSYTIPPGLPGGQLEFNAHPNTSTRQAIRSREWLLDETSVFKDSAGGDFGTPVRIQMPRRYFTIEDGKQTDFYDGSVRLRHYIDNRVEDGDEKWMFLPSCWKAYERQISVFCEDGVTQPQDTEVPEEPTSVDPNEIAGPEGVGELRKVKPGTWMTYTVYFENKPEATGAAQEVKITHHLDEDLDWSTFELVDVAYRNQIERGLAGQASGSATSDLQGTSYKVKTEATFDEATGQAYWYLRIVDESTPDLWPADAYAGLLPPNNDAHEGEGHVTYRVKVREDAADGARIDSTATIIFDYNEPIETDPAWWNTVAHVIDTASFEASVVEVEGLDGYAVIRVTGGSDSVATSVDLQILGGSMVLNEDYYFPETITLRWAKGDKTARMVTIGFNTTALKLGNKSISLGLTNAQGLALDPYKVCTVKLKRHIPTLTWQEGVTPSEALQAWVTEAAARHFIADGPITLATDTTVVDLEQARLLGIFPELTPSDNGGATAAVKVAFGLSQLLPIEKENALWASARLVAEVGEIATPYTIQTSFELLGGTTLDSTLWKPLAPKQMDEPQVLSEQEVIIPLLFEHPQESRYFFKLRSLDTP